MLRLSREALHEARTDGLERLARALGVALPRRTGTERQYRAALVDRIQRAEKLLSRAPKA